MSVIPYGPITDVRPPEYTRVPETRTSPDPATPLATQRVGDVEAAEELASGFTSRVRSYAAERDKSTLDRNAHQRAVMRQAYRISRLRRVYVAVDQAFWHDEVTPRADELLKVARQQGERLTDSNEEDPFKRYVSLLQAKEQAGGDTQVQQRLDNALDQLWEQYQNAIVAGFNTKGPLLRFARDLAEWDHFRRIYLECVVHGELAKTFKALLDRFGPGRLGEAIGTLRNAIAADLNSPVVCADETRWQQETLDLVDNRRIHSLIATSDDFCRRELLPKAPTPEVVMNFVGGLLEFVAGPNDRKLKALCAVLVSEEDVNEALRLRVCDFMKKHLPLWLWVTPEARDFIFPTALRARW